MLLVGVPCIVELGENLNAVFDVARHIAEQSNIETELVDKRSRKVSRRVDSAQRGCAECYRRVEARNA